MTWTPFFPDHENIADFEPEPRVPVPGETYLSAIYGRRLSWLTPMDAPDMGAGGGIRWILRTTARPQVEFLP